MVLFIVGQSALGVAPLGNGRAPPPGEPVDQIWKWKPENIIAGYMSDGSTITLPLASLPGVSNTSAHPISGDWRQIFQGMLLAVQAWVDDTPILERPKAQRSIMLEDWVRNDVKFGRHMKRRFWFEFIVDTPNPQIFNTEE